MGSPEAEKGRHYFSATEKRHRVRITQAFRLGVYEVTQAEYQAIMGKNPSKFKKNRVGMKTDQFPVENVPWDDAVEFCTKLSQKEGKQYRLPTEAEWEYACRAGTTDPFSFGSECNGAKRTSTEISPMRRQPRGPTLDERRGLGRTGRMRSGCTTCTGMLVNGVWIGSMTCIMSGRQ